MTSIVAAEPRATPRGPPPPSAEQLRNRAEELARRGELGEALQLATLAADVAPHDPAARRLLAKMHSAAGREDSLSSVR